METTVSGLIALFPETKSEISTFSAGLVNSILDGNTNPLRAKVQLTAMETVIKEINANAEFKDAVLNEANKYHKDELKDLYNSSIQVKETGVKYDYLNCGHTEYERICSEIDALTERRKGLEKYLQTLKGGEIYIDPFTGEQIELNTAIKTSTTSIAITLNK